MSTIVGNPLLQPPDPKKEAKTVRPRDPNKPILNKDIFPEETNWAANVKKYETDRKNLKWGFNPKPHVVTKEDMRKIDSTFDPITQKYHNKEFDEALKEKEKKDMITKISQYYDKELKYEQTFDVINLKDRLKGFESHPDYPKKLKEKEKVNKEISKCGYNILSNISLREHHFDAPEKRPNVSLDDGIPKYHHKKELANQYKDYDIITNNYRVYNKEKKETDIEIEKLNAAKKLNQVRVYDSIRGRYYNPEKQEEYERQLKLKNEELAKNGKKGQLFNLVNNVVYDPEGLAAKDQKSFNRKARYKLRPEIEQYYHEKDYNNDMRNEYNLTHRLNYDRFKVQDKRGYNFFNMKNTFNEYKNTISCKSTKEPWEIIQEKAGENETISKKGIYKDPYDKSDIDINEYNFKKSRRENLKNLPLITEQENFRVLPIHHKLPPRTSTVSSEFVKIPTCPFDKTKWFSGGKSVDMYNFKPVR